MSIDPNTLPDGTAVEIERCVFAIREDGQISSGFVGGVPFMPTKPITRVFVPVPDGMTLADAEAALADATPDQEVPRDEWANIAVGSRVRIVEVDGDEHTVTVDYVTADPWLYSKDHGYDGAKIARVYLLDAPTPPDPDAEAVEVMARVFVPVPDGMTHDEAVAALADAGAWVEVETVNGLPHGARMRNNWRQGDPADDRTYVHRDDLPPTDPDAELVAAIEKSVPIGSWDGREVLRRLRAEGFDVTHEATR